MQKKTVMNIETLISINPASKPKAAMKLSSSLRRTTPHLDSASRIMLNALKIVLGIGGSALHSRRLWTFRIIIGAIIMCFGLMFQHHTLIQSSEALMPGLPYVMVIGGAMIASGLLTRIVSIAMIAALTTASVQVAFPSMEAYATIICSILCLISLLSGSGRYSLDTIIYNLLSPLRRKKGPIYKKCSSYRRLQALKARRVGCE